MTTVTVNADDLRAVLQAAVYVDGDGMPNGLLGPVDRMGDALAIVTLGLPVSTVETEWEPIFTVNAHTDPSQRGTVYRLDYYDDLGSFELGDGDVRYHDLANIIDTTADER